MTRTRAFRDDPGQHDRSHPRSYDGQRRSLGAPHPTVPQNTRPVRTFVRRAAWTLITIALLLVAGYTALVVKADKAEPTPPSNQPTGATS